MEIIKGKRVYLRPLAKKDAKALAKLANDRSISRWTMVPRPYGLKDALDFIKKTQKKIRKKEAFELGMFLKKTNEFMGMCSIININKKNKAAEIGYWIGKPFRNKGYTTEAAKLMIDYGFKKLRLYRIQTSHAAGNKASGRVINKLGFKFEGLLRKHVVSGLGKRLDSVTYSILKPEYPKLKKKWH